MAKKNLNGLEIPFGITNPNKMYDLDSYRGPYDSLNDALDTITPELRVVGRKFAVYDTTNNSLIEYKFNQTNNGEWYVFKISEESNNNFNFKAKIRIPKQ